MKIPINLASQPFRRDRAILAASIGVSLALSATLLGHNPFVQPGVQAYKNAIFALAGKPGYEQERQRMEKAMAARQKVIID